jgi:penicillin amidase
VRRALRWTGLVLLLVGVLLAGAGLWFRKQLIASLPRLEGEQALHGLAADVRVERDARGVPTIRGENRADVSRALGFVHAQERFFQMDLLRRRAAGELAELFGGGAALDADRLVRLHRFRALAREVVARAAPGERALLESYAEGVNAGLGALGAAPFEYVLLRLTPSPWRAEDGVLVALAMFLTLQDERGRVESNLGLMADTLPPALFDFLAPRGTEWDAPVVGEAFAMPEIPGPEVFDLRRRPAPASQAASLDEPSAGEETAIGSNNWAVAGSRTTDGRAIVANDMHLGIGVPNTWYRVRLVFSERGEQRSVTGVTLPGAAFVVVGSNGDVAWGFTNSYGDWGDLVVLEPAPGGPDLYRTPEGPRAVDRVRELIRVKGAPDETLEVEETVWGPIVDRDHHGRRRALRWVAHDPEGVNLGLLTLEHARTLEEAQRAANLSGIPHQNFVCADRTGRVGWTIMGRIPRRVGFDGRLPGSWADGTRRWDGWLTPEEYPRIVEPPDGRIWTANARVVDGPMLAVVGDGGYDLGARAGQIRDGLRRLDRATERDMLSVQLDDRALFLSRWRELLLETLTPETLANQLPRAELRALVERWGARASVDSAGYRLVRDFRSAVAERALDPLSEASRAADERFKTFRTFQYEGPLWALVTQRPPHLLTPPFRTWDDLLLAAVDDTIEEMLEHGPRLAERTWGERNSPAIQHPLSRALPLLSRWLDMPRASIAGDGNMPRVQNGVEGASERLAVSPGHEADGYFHMPCGQSGHPLSPYYGDGHADWLGGEPTPFLPGPVQRTLTLRAEASRAARGTDGGRP